MCVLPSDLYSIQICHYLSYEMGINVSQNMVRAILFPLGIGLVAFLYVYTCITQEGPQLLQLCKIIFHSEKSDTEGKFRGQGTKELWKSKSKKRFSKYGGVMASTLPSPQHPRFNSRLRHVQCGYV